MLLSASSFFFLIAGSSLTHGDIDSLRGRDLTFTKAEFVLNTTWANRDQGIAVSVGKNSCFFVVSRQGDPLPVPGTPLLTAMERWRITIVTPEQFLTHTGDGAPNPACGDIDPPFRTQCEKKTAAFADYLRLAAVRLLSVDRPATLTVHARLRFDLADCLRAAGEM